MSDLLDQMRRNPRGDWTMQDIVRVCAEHDLACSAPKRGSHYKGLPPGLRDDTDDPLQTSG
ncbi:hypothetical protein [Tardiphaga sp.]|jgi:hypothetical protein|uniref:hypothetical protein n=1 Tax=Tardiphaga sp. TaxID=1926292 RepID=UPI0037D9B905